MTRKPCWLLLGSLVLARLAACQALAPARVQLQVPLGELPGAPGSLLLWDPGAGRPVATTLPEPESAPDTTRYYTATNENRVESEIDSTGFCTELLRTGPHQGLVRSFYPSGRLRTYVPYAYYPSGMRHGHVSSWYENGQMETLQPYVQGQRQGSMLLYYEDGRLKRQAQYEAGRELPGLCYDPAGQPVAYFPYEQPPLYPGGTEQLAHELKRALNRVYTRRVLVASYVQVSFLVSAEGRVEHPRLEVASLLPAYGQAVLTAVSHLNRFWVPGLRDGKRADYLFQLRVPVGATTEPVTLQQL